MTLAVYVALHVIGLAGMLGTLFLVNTQPVSAGLWGLIGGGWFATCVLAARWYVRRTHRGAS